MAEHTSQMLVEEFETIASAAPETVMLEFIDGRIEVRKTTDGDHGTIVSWLAKCCMRARPDLDLCPARGLRVDAYRQSRARPDAVLVPEAHFAGHGAWADPAGVLMAVEVTSYDADADRRGRHGKRVAYGESGIPVYLLIDRDSCTVTVHSGPDRQVDGYRVARVTKFGETLVLPDPVGIELDTEILKSYVR
ncbi:Uma2 family endonuclease [Streptomyces sp. NPDC056405]|uniref:Uma2 family endonuclease n=1 Tax=Streptomyces sp. NPDC056405 TaxID=3345811 RepID=UPI0035E2E30E